MAPSLTKNQCDFFTTLNNNHDLKPFNSMSSTGNANKIQYRKTAFTKVSEVVWSDFYHNVE